MTASTGHFTTTGRPAGDVAAVATIIRRELFTRLTNRAMIVSTLTLGVLVGLGSGVGGWLLVDAYEGPGMLAIDTHLLFAMVTISALLAAFVYSSHTLAAGVVAEKSSGVVELLLTKVKVGPLLAGKMIGVGLVTMAQLAVIGGAALTGFSLTGGWTVLNIQLGPNLLWLLVWFLLGFIIFATLSTLLASTVSRSEDLGAIATPLLVIQIVLLLGALYVVPQFLESAWVQFLAFIPLFSSYLMPMKFALGAVHTAELVVAALIATASVPLLFALTVSIYRNNALRTGARVPICRSMNSDEHTYY